MRDELLSVVVPVYNVKEYVEECITSILNQTYTNIELILVVNGPTDGSDKICRKYAEQDPRIKLIEYKDNISYMPALREGAKAASAEWMTQVDADDYVDADMFEKFMAYAGDNDLVTSNFKKITDGVATKYIKGIPVGKYCSEEGLDHLAGRILKNLDGVQDDVVMGSVWGNLFKRSVFLEALSRIPDDFPRWQDVGLYATYPLICRSIFISDICGYNYRVHVDSTMQSENPQYLSEEEKIYNYLRSVYEKHPRRKELLRQLEITMLDDMRFMRGFLGFTSGAKMYRYIFPFINMLDDKSIALYGAGDVGTEYYEQICSRNYCAIDMWVSKNWERECANSLPVTPVSDLLKDTYDHVVIAVLWENIAEEIRQELIELGVRKEKILWRKPIYTVNL